ncbi:MAG TPA: right-handed parallel beta-helix repeat-containing protein [Gemmatimonadaceae bacterium]|nr:right-handed parallel beta-helix repeat-containing protein [Gemmatimonadaceae bacterium]
MSGTTFSAGDSILLRRGTQCAGQLWPKGSGDAQRPIVIGAYGTGALPVIDASGADAAIKLLDQEHWVIETLESFGGSPYGVFVSGSKADMHGLVLRNLVVHDVSGEPKSKVTGLVVVSISDTAQLADVTIDGVSAYNTTEWAGIVVSGGWPKTRIRNVTVRNSIVHDVAGDGIILFSVESGLIERSAAWRSGLQPVQTIGTPNAIWTWTCRRCTVRDNEGFFIDSPGIDGGVYDIDYANDDNVVENNYGHDAMGYCVAVFAAGGLVTTNSVVRGNTCIANGRSPKLAKRQGDLYIHTWDGGMLDGIRVENNTFVWAPLVDAPVVMMDSADFKGTRTNVLAGNRLYTGVSQPIFTRDSAILGRNTIAPIPPLHIAPTQVPSGRFRLVLTGEDRSQVVFLETALAQYPDRLDATLVRTGATSDIAHDWNLRCIRLVVGPRAKLGLQLLSPDGREVAHWSRFASPAELGLALRRHLGAAVPYSANSPSCRVEVR